MSCPICLEPYTEASMLPACGHSFCSGCIDALPTTRTRGAREAQCPLCRVPFSPGSAVPNWSLRSSTTAPVATAAAVDNIRVPTVVAGDSSVLSVRSSPSAAMLAGLGVPPGLARIAVAEADKVAARIFLLDNSGSTNAIDGHVLKGQRLVSVSRWEEICASAEAACTLGLATGVPCEFHLLNPPRGGGEGAVEGTDYMRSTSEPDVERLRGFLRRVSPQGVTPLAERLHSLWPRFEALSGDSSGRVSFLVIMTDGAPTPPTHGTPTPQAATAALATLRRLTQQFPIRLVVRLCTDEAAAVSFWNQADGEVELPLDVLDDISGEAAEIHGCGNSWFAYSPALHLLRESGTTIGLLDLLDERRLRPGEAAVLAGLLLDGGDEPLPDWQHEAAEFAHAVSTRSAQAGNVFDARRRREAPIVDAAALTRSMRPASALQGLQLLVLILVLVVAWMIAQSDKQ